MVYDFLTEYREKPVNGPEHEALRSELWIGGADVVCCYYLSMLSGKDYSASSLTELRQDVTEYILQRTSRNAVPFVCDAGHYVVEFAMPFLKEQFGQAFGIATKLTKQENGMILLFKNPQWSDERIRLAIKTTDKQMNRWGWYRIARSIQARYELEHGTSTARRRRHAR